MDVNRSLRFDFISEAASFNNVIRRLKVYEARPVDKVENMMFEYMVKYLERLRDSLVSQGLNGIERDGILKELIEDDNTTKP